MQFYAGTFLGHGSFNSPYPATHKASLYRLGSSVPIGRLAIEVRRGSVEGIFGGILFILSEDGGLWSKALSPCWRANMGFRIFQRLRRCIACQARTRKGSSINSRGMARHFSPRNKGSSSESYKYAKPHADYISMGYTVSLPQSTNIGDVEEGMECPRRGH